MRNLNPFDSIPDKATLRARIPDPERFRPEPRVRKAMRWRMLDDGFGELYVEARGEWERIHPIFAELVSGLEAARTMDEIVERAAPKFPEGSPKACESKLRSFVWKLQKLGHVAIPLPEHPVAGDRYVRLRELGRGGVGVAHLYREVATGQEVVIKHAWGWLRSIERAEVNIRREAVALAAFDHPTIPTLRDTFEVGGLLHIVRDYAAGTPMNHLGAKLARASTAQRCTLGAHLAEGIHHVHERGFLFLDAKPGNFALDHVGGTPTMLDVGLCRPHEGGALKLRGSAGSRGYAAPEVIWQHRASIRSDVYSMGHVLFFMATGVTPRRSWKVDDLAGALEDKCVSRGESEIILHMSADDPGDRYADMAEAARDLRRLTGATAA